MDWKQTTVCLKIDARSIHLLSWSFYQGIVLEHPELKTEEGYSADIVRTYVYPWRYMSAQCRHNVRTTSHERYMSHEGDVVRT